MCIHVFSGQFILVHVILSKAIWINNSILTLINVFIFYICSLRSKSWVYTRYHRVLVLNLLAILKILTTTLLLKLTMNNLITLCAEVHSRLLYLLSTYVISVDILLFRNIRALGYLTRFLGHLMLTIHRTIAILFILLRFQMIYVAVFLWVHIYRKEIILGHLID